MEHTKTDLDQKTDAAKLTEIRTQCPHCEAEFRVKPEYSGRAAKCKHCEQTFIIPPLSATECVPVKVPHVSTLNPTQKTTPNVDSPSANITASILLFLGVLRTI